MHSNTLRNTGTDNFAAQLWAAAIALYTRGEAAMPCSLVPFIISV